MRASLNPLRVDGTALPPQVLLMAKLVALSLVVTGVWGLLAALAFVSLFFNVLVRLGCLLWSAELFESYLLPAVVLLAAAIYRPPIYAGFRMEHPSLRRAYPWVVWAAGVAMTAMAWSEGRVVNVVECLLLSCFLPLADWPRGRPLAIYDGACGFCIWVRKWLERLDWGRAWEWLPLQAPRAQALGIPLEALEARLHLVADDRVWTGFAAFRAMALFQPAAYFAAVLAVLAAVRVGLSNWVMAMLLLLFAPFLTPLGEAVYDWVARNRHRIPPRTCQV